MKWICLAIGLSVLCVVNARAQEPAPLEGPTIYPTKKNPDVFYTPTTALEQRLHPKLTDQEIYDYHWKSREDTEPSERKITKNIVTSETTPWRSARSVWASETMVARSAERGSGKYSKMATEGVMPIDRWMASQSPEMVYPGKAQDDAIIAAVYRYFFTYRARGFGKDTTVYFLGLGPHMADAPPSVVAAMVNDPTVKKDRVTIRPVSKAMEITEDAIRDRDTGEYGAVFRVDDVGPIENGEVKVEAAFSERDGFCFTRQLTLRQEKGVWTVVKETDLPTN